MIDNKPSSCSNVWTRFISCHGIVASSDRGEGLKQFLRSQDQVLRLLQLPALTWLLPCETFHRQQHQDQLSDSSWLRHRAIVIIVEKRWIGLVEVCLGGHLMRRRY